MRISLIYRLNVLGAAEVINARILMASAWVCNWLWRNAQFVCGTKSTHVGCPAILLFLLFPTFLSLPYFSYFFSKIPTISYFFLLFCFVLPRIISKWRELLWKCAYLLCYYKTQQLWELLSLCHHIFGSPYDTNILNLYTQSQCEMKFIYNMYRLVQFPVR